MNPLQYIKIFTLKAYSASYKCINLCINYFNKNKTPAYIYLIALGLIITGATLNHYSKQQRDDLFESAKKRVIAPLVIARDNYIKKTMGELKSNPRISSIKLYNANGVDLFSDIDEENFDDYNLAALVDSPTQNSTPYYKYSSPIFIGDNRIGHLEILMTPFVLGGYFIDIGIVFMLIGLAVHGSGWKADFRNPSNMTFNNDAKKFLNDAGIKIQLERKISTELIPLNSFGIYFSWTDSNLKRLNIRVDHVARILSANNLITPIIPWIYQTSISEVLKNIEASSNYDVDIPVNIEQFFSSPFLDSIKAICDDLNFSRKRLVIELSEWDLSRTLESDIGMAWRLWSDAGFGICISGFGSSSGSASFIKRPGLRKIKWNSAFLLRREPLENDFHLNSLKHMLANHGIQSILTGPICEKTITLAKRMECQLIEEELISGIGDYLIKSSNHPILTS